MIKLTNPRFTTGQIERRLKQWSGLFRGVSYPVGIPLTHNHAAKGPGGIPRTGFLEGYIPKTTPCTRGSSKSAGKGVVLVLQNRRIIV